MANHDRDILKLLKEELDSIEKGGYGRSVHTLWKPESTFKDSLTGPKYGYLDRAHPCNESDLFDFVSPEQSGTALPCHNIRLNETGETIKDSEAAHSEAKLEAKLKDWLHTTIKGIEEERATQAIAGRP